MGIGEQLAELAILKKRVKELETKVTRLENEINKLKTKPSDKQKFCDCCVPKHPIKFFFEEWHRKGIKFTKSYFKCLNSGEKYPLDYPFSEG